MVVANVSRRQSVPDLATVPGVELFAAGMYRGRRYTVRDLQQMAENFDRLGPAGLKLLQPPAVLGHEEDQEFLERTDLPAAGWLKRVWRRGAKLLGDFAEVPASVARMINARAYRKVSAEIYDDFTDDFGRGYGKAIRRIALLGGEVPQVKRLADIPLARFADGQRPSRLERPIRLRARLTPGNCVQSRGRGTFLCFSEVSVDRPAMIAALLAAMPTLDQAAIDTMTDDQLKALVASLPQPAAAAPAAAMADLPREDLLAELVTLGQDPASLDPMTDEQLKALYDQLTGASAAAMSDVDGVEMSREEMIAALVAKGEDPAAIELLDDEALATKLRTPTPAAPMSDKKPKPAAKAAAFSELDRKLARAERTLGSLEAREKRLTVNERKAKRQDAETFCEKLVHEGRILPVERADFVEQLLGKDDSKVQKFNEGGKTVELTAFAKKKADLAARPKIVHFGERLKPTQGGGDLEVQKVQAFADTQRDSLNKAGLTPEKYVDRFKAMQAKKKDLTAKAYGVPAEYC